MFLHASSCIISDKFSFRFWSLLMLKEDAGTSESTCGGTGKVLARHGSRKIRLADGTWGSKKIGAVSGQTREEGKGLMLGGQSLLPDSCQQRQRWKWKCSNCVFSVNATAA